MNIKNNIETDIAYSANSGAKISIISENNATFIKKSEKYQLERYKISISKQESFIPIGSFKSALILDKKISKKNIDILMPFYNGISGSNFSKRVTLSDIDFLSKALIDYFTCLKEQSVENSLDGSLLINKCKLVGISINKNKFFNKNEKSFLLKVLKNLMDSVKKSYLYPFSRCHGDLTLSNIIYDKENKDLILIDFLETYISSYLIDIAKIKQDLIYGWSFRRDTRTVKMKAFIMGEYIFETIYPLIEDKYIDLFKIIDCLNTLRIAPYVDDKNSKEWLIENLRILNRGV